MPDVVFYDGDCGLCHGAVRFFLFRDRTDTRFAPLGGATFQKNIAPEIAKTLPDSLVLRTEDGRVLTRSRAVLALLRRLSLPYRMVAAAGGLLPASLLDTIYDAVARTRQRLFSRPSGTCPLMPPHLARRFDP